MTDVNELVKSATWAILLYAGLSLAEIFLIRFRVVRRVGIVLNLTFLCWAAHLFVINPFLATPGAGSHAWLTRCFELVFLTLAAYAVIRLLDGLIFDVLIQRRKRRAVPVVVRDILRWLVTAAVFFLILRAVFPDLNLNVVAISSIVVGYILGNATQDTLGNLVAGLAISVESPFSIGDWVTVGGHTGRVVEMTWRATCLHTKANDYILIPNASIAREPIVNYSRPTRVHAVVKNIGVSYAVAPSKVRRVILGALDVVPEALKDPAPSVWLSEYGDFAVVYRVKFFVADFENIDRVESDFFELVWYHFRRAGVEIPFPIRDLRVTQTATPSKETQEIKAANENLAFLDAIDLFAPLSAEDRARVAASLREEIYARGEVLVRQGDPGDVFYIVKSGRVTVSALRGETEVELARLGEGDFFGEMSLLTGQRRNATVTAETDTHVLALSHEVLGELLKKNASLSEELAGRLASRARDRLRMDETVVADTQILAPTPSKADILDRIRVFFRLGKK